MAKTPIQIVKERFSDKAGLVKAVQGLMGGELTVDRLNSDKGLDSVWNKKLLHLHDVLSLVKKDFGSRDKLIKAIADSSKKAKDADFAKSLEGLPTPRLFELYRSSDKRSKKRAQPAAKSASK
jgi:hypothetical protein